MSIRVSHVEARLDSKPWGGTRLRQYGFPIGEGETIGESLITAGDAVVKAGFGAGRTLDDIVSDDPLEYLGLLGLAAVSGRAVFPLLAKIIDARQHLSIQVHPNDDGASSVNKLGKTEAWHVLAADDDAPLFVGLRSSDAFEAFRERAALLDGSSAEMLRVVPAVPGETMLLPAGTIHALGAGVMVYEIQQPSDITYRLDDWGRVDAQGQPREMHLDAGFAVSRPHLQPRYISPVSIVDVSPVRRLLTACRYFALERLEARSGEVRRVGVPHSPVVVTVLSGVAQIAGHTYSAGESAVIWPTSSTTDLTFVESGHALISWVPDLVADVVQPAKDAGYSDAEIAALAGDSGDLATILAST